jgi:hypothetical protein
MLLLASRRRFRLPVGAQHCCAPSRQDDGMEDAHV